MGRFSREYTKRVRNHTETNKIYISELSNLSSCSWYKDYNPLGVFTMSKKYRLYGFTLKRMLKLWAREDVYFSKSMVRCNHAWIKELTGKFAFISYFWWTCRKCRTSTRTLNISDVSEPLRNAYKQHLR